MNSVFIDEDYLNSIKQSLNLPELNLNIFSHNIKMNTLRIQLRMEIIKHLEKNNFPFNKDSLLNLGELPKIPNGDISLSHSPTFAGFAFTKDIQFLGFDIEPMERVKEKIVRRICSDKEFKDSPGATELWVAKEASFKALSKFMGIRLVSDVYLSQWFPVGDELLLATSCVGGSASTQIRGLVARVNNCIFSIFCIPLNFRPGGSDRALGGM